MSNPPEGTKPWRKGWRKRWREGSSFRGLSLVAKVLVLWVEENANDQGRVVTTIRHLTSMVSGKHYRQKVPRMTVWRALKEATDAGVLVTEAGQDAGQANIHPPTIITRCNYKDYQDKETDIPGEAGQALVTEAGRSSRGRQKKQITTCPEAAPPGPPPVVSIPCVGKHLHEYGVTQAQVASWAVAYPGVNVPGELEKARVWCEANPTKRKTHGGVPRFLVSWLNRAQDRPSSQPSLRLAASTTIPKVETFR